jgi:hydrogenase-4 component F
MALVQILLPVVLAGLAFAIPSNRWRPLLLPVNGAVHLAITLAVLIHPALGQQFSWLVLDPVARLVLLLVSVLYLVCACYAVGYLEYRQERPNRVFTACLCAFPGMVSLVIWAHHLGLMWVAMEATALVSGPLIYFNHTTRSIEATWKYLLIGSVGIALALLGTFFLAYAALHGGQDASLTYEYLVANAKGLSTPWLHAAFVLLLVGYGTKMGLAPMHTWKPDAYGEAPGMVGALLAGGLTNCAFLAIVRMHHILVAAGEGAFASRNLLLLGLFSMALAGAFMVGQKDFKRMLAYSSVEHMGILVLGLGIGGAGIFAALLHMLNNGLTKGVLFLSAGNLHRAYGSKNTLQVSGALRRLPLSAGLFLAGFLAITGAPPFAPFISEFALLNAAFETGHFVVGGLYLLLLLVVFIGMGATVLAVVQGQPSPEAEAQPYRDTLLTSLPPLLLLLLVLLLGLVIPAPLADLLREAVNYLRVS